MQYLLSKKLRCHGNGCTRERVAPSLLTCIMHPTSHVGILILSAVVAVLSKSRRMSPALSLYKSRKDAPMDLDIDKIVSSKHHQTP